MDKEKNSGSFLTASQLLEVRGISNTAWEDFQQSEFTLPKIGQKHFEPNNSWLETMQLENGLKNRKRILEIERVERLSQLASAEWLPGSQRARVTKKSGQKWQNFGSEEKDQLYLLPEEALILMEMSCLELHWNGLPLSIQQAYDVLILSEKSKCNLDEYKVYSQLIKIGYKLQRYHSKKNADGKSLNTAKRIIMNPNGLWTPHTSPKIDDHPSTYSLGSQSNTNKREKINKSPKLGILREETVLGNIKVVKDNSSSLVRETGPAKNQWSGTRVQCNFKSKPKRSDAVTNYQDADDQSRQQKRSLDSSEKDGSAPKRSRPEVIELSDDEIEEIPHPLSRAEILNTLPNLAGSPCTEPLIAQLPRPYLPPNINPIKHVYHFDRYRLLNLSQTDNDLRQSNFQQITPINNGHASSSHFYGTSREYIHQNISHHHNTIQHNNYPGAIFQSNYVTNFVMEVMGNMVRSFRQHAVQQTTTTTTYCQNLQVITPRLTYQQPHRFHHHAYNPMFEAQQSSHRDYGMGYRKSYNRSAPSTPKGRMDRMIDTNKIEEPYQPVLSKYPGVKSWSELKSRWREESTITIEDEEPSSTVPTTVDTGGDVQVVEESVSPLIASRSGISSISEVYQRLRIIKCAGDKNVRSRRIDYSLSYEVYPINENFRKSAPGTPLCRLFVVNSEKESNVDVSKLQRMQQESKEIPIVVACVSHSRISYLQPGAVCLPNYS